jgi:hypothetical protein
MKKIPRGLEKKNWADWEELYSGCPKKFWLSPTIPDL